MKFCLACRSEIGSICAGRTAKVPQPHRPSTHQGSPSRSIPSASLPASCTEDIQNICSGTPRHLSATCPSSWHKNHVPELCQPRQRLRCSLTFSSGEHGCPPPGLPRALELPARRIQDHRDTGGEPGALGAAGDLPTAEDTSEAQNRQSFRAGTEQRCISGRCSRAGPWRRVKGARAGSGTKPHPRAVVVPLDAVQPSCSPSSDSGCSVLVFACSQTLAFFSSGPN